MIDTHMLAEVGSATNTQVGSWVIILFAVINGAVGIITVFSLFATRREVDKLDNRVTKLEDSASEFQKDVLEKMAQMGKDIRAEINSTKDTLVLSGDKRSSVLHNRINPVTTNLSEMKGMMEAFTQSFDNFTEVMKAMNKGKN